VATAKREQALMIIYLRGNDSLLAKLGIDQIKAKYLSKNPQAVELVEIDEASDSQSWADLRSVPLFASSRLFILRRLGSFTRENQLALAQVLPEIPPSTVVVAWDRQPPADKALQAVLSKAPKIIEVATPQGGKLKSWIVSRAKELTAPVDEQRLGELVASGPSDLWQLETALRQLATGASLEQGSATEIEPFVFFRALRRGDWQLVKEEIVKRSDEGEPIELTVGGLGAAVRRELTDQAQAKKLLEFLLDLDIGVKNGLLQPTDAASLLVAHLPEPNVNRVQWEAAHEETFL
jgi:hypothetical protein